jgi:hypothetical protein
MELQKKKAELAALEKQKIVKAMEKKAEQDAMLQKKL